MSTEVNVIEDVKPCPKCGHSNVKTEVKILTKFEFGDDQIRVYAYCPFCQERGLSAIGRMTIEEGKKSAIKLWNEVREK